MAQLFLYLTFVIASTVIGGEGMDLNAENAENAIEQNISCVEQDLSNKNTVSDDPEDSFFTPAQLISISAELTDLSHFIPGPTNCTVGNYSIRAPPILLS